MSMSNRRFTGKLVFIFTFCLICTIFAGDNNQLYEITSAKRCWYYFIAFIIIFFDIFYLKLNSSKETKFPILELIFLLSISWIAIIYNYNTNYAPHFLSITSLSLPIYLYIKQGIKLSRRMPDMIELLLGVVLIYISYIGLRQLFGFENSYHTKFKVTGPFFNPGPYGGFIAILQPLILWNMLKYERLKPKNIFSAYSIIGKIYQIAFWISLIVLPLTMSRTAWVASVAGMGLVLIIRYKDNIRSFISDFRLRYRKGVIFIGILVILFCGISGYMLFHMKKDSANGRLFMWKISLNAIKESPIIGTGSGGFAKAYGKAQHDYFAKYDQPESLPESRVAGSPEYAFNEYLQIAIEFGILGLILFLSILLISLISMIKEREAGLAGSVLAFMIFSFASYPLRVLPFHVILISIFAIISLKTEKLKLYSLNLNRGNGYIMASMMILSLIVFYQRRHEYNSYKEFNILKYFDVERGDESLLRDYAALYKDLHYEPEFLFNYGKLLAVKNRYEESNKILRRGTEVSTDPMFYNLIGKNYQAMGDYEKAEENYIYSHNLLPNRFYPLYLLVKMYSETDCFSKDKIERCGNQILNKEIKIQSPAIKDMQREVKLILTDYKDDNKWDVKD